jgi:voltage-gated potassium channel
VSADAAVLREHGNAYNIFILVLTVFSLAVMVLLLLPLSQPTRDLLLLYDNVVCLIFLGDFAYNLSGSTPKRAYFVSQRGWLGILQVSALFRLARLSRLVRITRLLRGQAGKDLVLDVLRNRGQYATFITILLAGIVLSVASLLVLQFESRSDEANIRTGGDAIWWGLVTITTVGYGDFYPVTTLGRMTGVFVMFAGIGIIGALASILASLLVAPATEDPAPEPAGAAEPAKPPTGDVAATQRILDELAGLRGEVAGQRAEIAGLRARLEGPSEVGDPPGTLPT